MNRQLTFLFPAGKRQVMTVNGSMFGLEAAQNLIVITFTGWNVILYGCLSFMSVHTSHETERDVTRKDRIMKGQPHRNPYSYTLTMDFQEDSRDNKFFCKRIIIRILWSVQCQERDVKRKLNQ